MAELLRRRIKDIELMQGDDQTVVFELKKDDGTNYDAATGHTAKLMARVAIEDAAPVVSLTEAAGITLGNGTATVAFVGTDTDAYDFDEAIYDLEITKTTGPVNVTAYRGKIKLIKEVAR